MKVVVVAIDTDIVDDVKVEDVVYVVVVVVVYFRRIDVEDLEGRIGRPFSIEKVVRYGQNVSQAHVLVLRSDGMERGRQQGICGDVHRRTIKVRHHAGLLPRRRDGGRDRGAQRAVARRRHDEGIEGGHRRQRGRILVQHHAVQVIVPGFFGKVVVQQERRRLEVLLLVGVGLAAAREASAAVAAEGLAGLLMVLREVVAIKVDRTAGGGGGGAAHLARGRRGTRSTLVVGERHG